MTKIITLPLICIMFNKLHMFSFFRHFCGFGGDLLQNHVCFGKVVKSVVPQFFMLCCLITMHDVLHIDSQPNHKSLVCKYSF